MKIKFLPSDQKKLDHRCAAAGLVGCGAGLATGFGAARDICLGAALVLAAVRFFFEAWGNCSMFPAFLSKFIADFDFLIWINFTALVAGAVASCDCSVLCLDLSLFGGGGSVLAAALPFACSLVAGRFLTSLLEGRLISLPPCSCSSGSTIGSLSRGVSSSAPSSACAVSSSCCSWHSSSLGSGEAAFFFLLICLFWIARRQSTSPEGWM